MSLMRFKTFFGDVNDYVVLGNHSVVFIDTITLSANERPELQKEPTDFLHEIQKPSHPAKEFPRILLSHVPLYRFTDTQECGPLRESHKKFPMMKGNQYQTAIEFDISQSILNSINPKLILSGDDHDICAVRHPFNMATAGLGISGKPGTNYADEVTIKSSAMTGGIQKPAVQLITMWNPQNEDGLVNNQKPFEIKDNHGLVIEQDTLKTRLCLLPEPYYTLKAYGVIYGLCVFTIVICTLIPALGRKINNVFRKLVKIRRNDGDPFLQPKQNQSKFRDRVLNWEIGDHFSIVGFTLNLLVFTVVCFFTLRWYFSSI
ncbi:unnamed protein product [Ambrosiozyma monospora]|uniref:Unnamed protein product n=1 Tax=Ambrosiozyma monospora TaxID=43982 RepID=A0A9W6Z120_AMBMO|nr:unnamed protein product [Ambrosiozyma monospora]